MPISWQDITIETVSLALAQLNSMSAIAVAKNNCKITIINFDNLQHNELNTDE
jgi:hypothetical protein